MSKRATKRGNLYLLTGLILGLAFGLMYAWVISPVVYVDAGPYSLREDFKDQYRLLVALAYLADNNLPRAQARLDQLKDPEIPQTIAMQAQRSLTNDRPELETRALGLLAVALGESPVPLQSPSPVPPSPTIEPSSTLTPTPLLLDTTVPVTTTSETLESASRSLQPTSTSLPSRTPTTIPSALFSLEEQALVCNPDFPDPLLQVIVLNAEDEQVPGIEIVVTWEGGEEHFFTGLKPELGLGYVDFAMTYGQVYVLSLAGGGQPVTDLAVEECEAEDGTRYYGSWWLVFSANG